MKGAASHGAAGDAVGIFGDGVDVGGRGRGVRHLFFGGADVPDAAEVGKAGGLSSGGQGGG